jgi:pimeloyl-ACP methyl ester carboxylesterase
MTKFTDSLNDRLKDASIAQSGLGLPDDCWRRAQGRSRLSGKATRAGVLAMNAIALMDGLGIQRFSVVGHDWESHIAECLAIG